MRECAVRIGLELDLREVRRLAPRAASAGSARGLSEAVATRRGASVARSSSMASASLSARIEATTTSTGSPMRSRSHAVPAGVRAVPELAATVLEASWKGHARLGFALAPEEDVGRLSRVSRHDFGALRYQIGIQVVRQDNYSGRMSHGKLLLRDLLRRVAEHLGVLEADVGQGQVSRRWSRRAARRGLPRRQPPLPGVQQTRGVPRRSAPRTASRRRQTRRV